MEEQTVTAKALIKKLALAPHPEGGYYRETYRSNEIVGREDGASRAASTIIYFLLCDEQTSHWHRLSTDESWFFHVGQPIEFKILEGKEIKTIALGSNVLTGEEAHIVVPAGKWFAARVKGGSGYALVSCVVAPGFEFSDFELATAQTLQDEGTEITAAIREFLL